MMKRTANKQPIPAFIRVHLTCLKCLIFACSFLSLITRSMPECPSPHVFASDIELASRLLARPGLLTGSLLHWSGAERSRSRSWQIPGIWRV